MLFVLSAIYPSIGGKIAPPTIDMIIKLDPDFVSIPRSCIPKAKMVGNIIDIKKEMPITAYNVIIPDAKIVTRHKRILKTEYNASSLAG